MRVEHLPGKKQRDFVCYRSQMTTRNWLPHACRGKASLDRRWRAKVKCPGWGDMDNKERPPPPSNFNVVPHRVDAHIEAVPLPFALRSRQTLKLGARGSLTANEVLTTEGYFTFTYHTRYIDRRKDIKKNRQVDR